MADAAKDQVIQLLQQAEQVGNRGQHRQAGELLAQAASQARSAFGDQSELFAEARRLQADLALFQGELDQALPLYQETVQILERLVTPKAVPLALAPTLISLSRVYVGRGAPQPAHELRQRAGRLLLADLASGARPVTQVLVDLAAAAQAADPAEAEALYRAILAVLLRQPGAALPLLVFTVELGSLLADLGCSAEAAEFLANGLAVLTIIPPGQRDRIQGSALKLADLCRQLDRADQALPLYASIAAANGPEVAQASQKEARCDALIGQALAHQDLKHFDQAETLLRDALAYSTQAFGQADNRTAQAAMRLADLFQHQQRYAKALPSYELAAQSYRATVGPRDADYADALEGLAICHDQLGNYAEAEERYREVIKIRDLTLGRSHPAALRARQNLAELARARGDFPTAAARFEQLLREIQAANLPPSDSLALIKNNLGEVYNALGRAPEALALVKEAYRLRAAWHGPDSADAARSLTALSALCLDQNRLRAAFCYGTLARRIHAQRDMRRSLASDDLGLARILARQGKHTAAVTLLEAVIKELPDLYGALHPVIGNAHYLIAYSCARQSQWAPARAHLASAMASEDEALIQTMLSAPRDSLAEYLRRERDRLSLFISAVLNDPACPPVDQQTAYARLQRIKGLENRTLRLLNRQSDVVRQNEDEIMELLQERQTVRQQLTRVRLEGEQVAGAGQVNADIGAFEQRLRDLDRQLGRFVGEDLLRSEASPLGSGEIAAALPAGSVLVEYVVFTDRTAEPVARYAAFIVPARPGALSQVSYVGNLGPNLLLVGASDIDQPAVALSSGADGQAPSAPLTLVDIGAAAEIDRAIDELRGSLVDYVPQSDGRLPAWVRKGRYLYNRLIRPLPAALKDAQHVFIAPDGALNGLPFEILPNEAGYLIDAFTLSYLLLGREALRFLKRVNPPTPSLVLAAPDYAHAAPAAGSRPGPLPADRIAELRRAPRFVDLDHTLAEGQNVAGLLGVPALTGDQAVETALRGARSPEIVHIVTHGFYLPRAAAGEPPPGLLSADRLDRRAGLEDPLERSGLALAGANAFLDLGVAVSAADDGILFASEIVDLELSNTDLVFLAACQSGQGDVQLGAGVQGLRSAFSAAGCRSVISALWKIPDAKAAAMAAMFYEELLKGERRVAALYAAKREMRRLNPLDPIAWGGLILDGNPARLARFEPLSQLSVATLVWPKVLGPALTSAETIPPAEQAEALYQQGLGQMHDQADDQAEQAFTAAMNLEGARAETAALALYERAGLYRRRGQLPLAFQDYARLLSIRNVPPRLRLGALADRGTTHIMNHDDAAAIADYTAYVQLPDVSESDRLQVLQNRGFAYLRNGNFEAAAADFTTIITTPGADRVQRAKALGNRGECYRHRGQCDLALQDVDLGLRMGVGDAQLIRLLHTVRALTYFDSGALPQAVAELTFLLAEPDVPAGAAEIDLWYRAGAYQALGQVDQARLDYQALIDLPNASANYVDDARQRLVALNTDP